MHLFRTWSRVAAVAVASACMIQIGCTPPKEVPPEARTVDFTPFTPADQPQIAESYLHQAHAKDTPCVKCHVDTNVASITNNATTCIACHTKIKIKSDMWRGHCLVCHDFSAPKTKGRMQAPKLEQCLECHKVEQAGSDIYGFYRAASKMQFTCAACHNPHAEKQPEPPQMCTNCHGEMANTALFKQGHVNCTACHTPHSWKFTAKQGCKTCHTQPPRVNVHLIGAHPQDCTKCHSPHFTDKKLKGALCQTCHKDKTYLAGRSQPKQHQACLNCHKQQNWVFKGSGACATCHKDQGALLTNAGAPQKHKNCTTCHGPHNFRTSFDATCKRCHDLGRVFEHRIQFHPQQSCAVCHDAHMATLPPKSGDCAGCHGAAIPDFAVPSPEPHTECANCHSQESIDARKFEFVGPENSCQMCHPVASTEPDVAWDQAPSGHLLCNACHKAHTWKAEAGPATCGVCHADAVEQATASGMPDCFTCHEANHLAKFTGVENSCAVCHTQQAQETAGKTKADCTLCHNKHSFKPDISSCTVCHTDLPGTHSASGHAECLNCHTMHSLKVDPAVCTVCHTDRAEHFPGQECLTCHKFRQDG
jgi:hypothetical protein